MLRIEIEIFTQTLHQKTTEESKWCARLKRKCSNWISCCKAILLSNTKYGKAYVINDPLGQTHGTTSSNHYFHYFILLCFEKWGRTDGRTDKTCENGDHYQPGLWVGLVDQNWNFSSMCENNDHHCTVLECGTAEWINMWFHLYVCCTILQRYISTMDFLVSFHHSFPFTSSFFLLNQISIKSFFFLILTHTHT